MQKKIPMKKAMKKLWALLTYRFIPWCVLKLVIAAAFVLGGVTSCAMR